MVVKFSEAQKKWRDNTKGAADVWATNVAAATALENYIRNLVGASEGRVTEAEFRASGMVAHYSAFQGNVGAKKEDFKNGVERAYTQNRWINGLVNAMKRKVAA
jgi:hypothetical protein